MNSTTSPRDKIGGGCALAFMLVWLAGWSAGTLAFDGVWLYSMYSQFRALGYPTAPGEILTSELEERRDSDGDRSLHAKIVYQYSLDGAEFTGDDVRFGMNMMMQPRKLVEKYPLGAEVQVYYDPQAADRSALEIGFRADDFFLPLFLTPFNVIMIGVASFVLPAVLPVRRWLGLRPGRISIRQTASGTEFRIHHVRAWQAAGVAAGAAAFVLVFLVGFGQFLLPLTPLVVFAWIGILAAVVFGATRAKWSALEVDPFRNRLAVVKDGRTNEHEISRLVSYAPNAKGGIKFRFRGEDSGANAWLVVGGERDAGWLAERIGEIIGRPPSETTSE